MNKKPFKTMSIHILDGKVSHEYYAVPAKIAKAVMALLDECGNDKTKIVIAECENSDKESNPLCECCELKTVCCYVKECDSEELKEKRLNFQQQLLEDYRNAKKNRGNEET